MGGKRRTLLAIFAAIVLIAIFAGLLWPTLTNRDDVCRSAWPVVDIKAGEGFAPDADFITSFTEFLGHYQMFVLRQNAPPDCAGVPQMVLTVSREADRDVAVQLRDRATGVILDSERFAPLPSPGYDPELILAARIAYQWGQPNGLIATEAWKLPWENKDAAAEYACLVDLNQTAHGVDGRNFEAVHQCLGEYAMQSAHAYVPIHFVFADNILTKGKDNLAPDLIMTDDGRAAYRRARTLDPTLDLVMFAQLREFLAATPSGGRRVQNQINEINRLYWYDPLIQNNIATICAVNLANLECARERAHLAGLIAPGDQRFVFGRIYANMMSGNPADLVQDRETLMAFYHFKLALAALDMAPYGPSPTADRNAALEWLARDGYTTASQLTSAISELVGSDELKIALNDSVARNFGMDTGRVGDTMADWSDLEATIP